MRVSAPRRSSRNDDTNADTAASRNDNAAEGNDQANQSNASEQNQEATGYAISTHTDSSQDILCLFRTSLQNRTAGQLVDGQPVKVRAVYLIV